MSIITKPSEPVFSVDDTNRVLEATKLNQEVFKIIQITSQENMIINSLEKFYENDAHIKLFIPFINSESKISIRLIDYFVTKFSKNHKINYKLKENDVEQTFNVYTSYKQQLKAFQKVHFDPFSRGDRVPYFIDGNCIITTIGQLNFFRWFISKKIYDYIELHQNRIEDDMNKKNKINKKESKPKTPKPTNIQPLATYSNTPVDTKRSIFSFAEPKTSKIIVSFSF
jgi:hypothetical protein